MRRVRAVPAAILLLAAAGCAAAPDESDPWPGGALPQDRPVGWLDGRPVTYGEVSAYLRTKDPAGFARSLEGLVLERVTRAEARALGVEAPGALVRRAAAARLEEWKRRLRSAAQSRGESEVDPAVWLERAGGVPLETFRAWVRRHSEVELLQDRLLRYEQLRSPRIEVSVLVVEDRKLAEKLAARLRNGADFAALARRYSRHATRGEGGRLPFPLLPEDIAVPSIRRALFRARPGAVAGPFEAEAGGRRYYQIYRLERRAEALEGTYAELTGRIEADLARRPVHVGEYERWRRRVLLRHGWTAAHAAGEPQ